MSKMIIVLILLIFILSGCNKKEVKDFSDVSSIESLFENASQESETTQVISEEIIDVETKAEQSEKSVLKNQQSNTQTVSQNQKDSSLLKSEVDKAQKETIESKLPDVEPVSKNAVMTDSKAISDILIKYINTYRMEQGIPVAMQLSGLTEFAEYRSRQLVTNFTHDIYDERSAATAIKYGKYIDPALWGIDEEPYYTACAGEAIALGGYIGTVDYIAQSLARQVRDSSRHWAYVGSDEYPYIAVGITLDSGTWYCDIAMSRTNEYEK